MRATVATHTLRGSGAAQHAGAFGGRSAGRVNIIHEKHFTASDFRGTRDGKGSAQVDIALVAGQANLRRELGRYATEGRCRCGSQTETRTEKRLSATR